MVDAMTARRSWIRCSLELSVLASTSSAAMAFPPL
jgi:hypothetical protein